MNERSIIRHGGAILSGILVLVALYLTSAHSYLLFQRSSSYSRSSSLRDIRDRMECTGLYQ